MRSKLWFEVDGRFAIGQGGIELLRAIEVNGSLAGGARVVGWSYRHAWGYVRRAEAALQARLLITRAGKGPRRGAILTDAAKRLIQTAEGLTTSSRDAAAGRWQSPTPS